MKKLLVLLLISIMAIFVFAGCDGVVPGEGEGEGEGEIEGVVVEVQDEVKLGGKTWIKGGVSRDITVTFTAQLRWQLLMYQVAMKNLILAVKLLHYSQMKIRLFGLDHINLWEMIVVMLIS